MNRLAARLSAPALALLLGACGGGPRPMGEAPPPLGPPPPLHARTAPPRPLPPPVRNAAPAGPVAPLTVARVESYMDGLESDLRHHVRGPGLIVARQGNNITLVIPNTLLFSRDGGVAGDDVLEPLAATLRSYPHTAIAVNGYTDTAGKPERNLAVSQGRARLIASALAHEGVPAGHVAAQGFGEAHPRIATGDDKNEPRNRRIEIVIHPVPG